MKTISNHFRYILIILKRLLLEIILVAAINSINDE